MMMSKGSPAGLLLLQLLLLLSPCRLAALRLPKMFLCILLLVVTSANGILSSVNNLG